MTDYLTRLIARANGAEALVLPLLTPAFAGRGEGEFGAGQCAFAVRDQESRGPREFARPARSLETLAARSPYRLPAPPVLAGLPKVDRATGLPLKRRPNREVEAPPTGQAIGVPDGAKTEPSPGVRPALGPDSVFAQSGRAEPGAAPVAAPPPDSSSSREPVRARVETAHAPPAALQSEANTVEAPAILRISIGRIEVRAIPRPAQAHADGSRPAQPARRFNVAPKLTLEQYLNRHEVRS